MCARCASLISSSRTSTVRLSLSAPGGVFTPERRARLEPGPQLVTDRVPVGGRPQVAQDAEDEVLHPAQQQRLRWDVERAHELEPLGAEVHGTARELDGVVAGQP